MMLCKVQRNIANALHMFLGFGSIFSWLAVEMVNAKDGRYTRPRAKLVQPKTTFKVAQRPNENSQMENT